MTSTTPTKWVWSKKLKKVLELTPGENRSGSVPKKG